MDPTWAETVMETMVERAEQSCALSQLKFYPGHPLMENCHLMFLLHCWNHNSVYWLNDMKFMCQYQVWMRAVTGVCGNAKTDSHSWLLCCCCASPFTACCFIWMHTENSSLFSCFVWTGNRLFKNFLPQVLTFLLFSFHYCLLSDKFPLNHTE